jgi:UPF0755 protein
MVDTETISEQAADGDPRRGRRAAIAIIAVAGAVVVVAAAWFGARAVGTWDSWDVEPGLSVEVTVDPGASARAIYDLLESEGVARASALEEAANRLGVEDRLQAGTYALVTDMDPEVAIRQLVAGGNVEAADAFTVVEGWTLDRLIQELSAFTGYSQAEFQRVLRNGEVASPLLPPIEGPVDSLTRWEGLLFPARYPIGPEATPASILGAMADEMVRRVEGVNWSRLDALGVTRYEAIIVASLIEREAGTDEERPTIASVIYNRLAVPMRLQIDATVIYALGYNPGRVTSANLDVESPYNTYRVDGLPPTPIGTVSEASLEAAANPTRTEYLFYVLGNEDGSHLFATTYEEHQANIDLARQNGVRP